MEVKNSMMKVSTKIFGDIELDENEVFEFPNGLIGFPDKRKFVFLTVQGINVYDGLPIDFILCLDDTELCFATCDPLKITSDYSILASHEEVSDIDLSDPTDAIVRVVLTLPKKDSKTKTITANLLAPIIINARNKMGKQLVVDGDEELLNYEIVKQTEEKTLKDEQSSHATAK